MVAVKVFRVTRILPRLETLFLLLTISTIFFIYYNQPVGTIEICSDPFFVRVAHTTNTPHKNSSWPCYVRPPQGYRAPVKERALWSTPRKNVGKLDTENPEYNLHVRRQRWAFMNEDTIDIREQGGTSGRAFKDNFEYVRRLKNNTQLCHGSNFLDMGAGIGSVGAAVLDERGLSGEWNVMGYVWPDDYMRLQTIMSDRGLVAFLANFTGRLPFPSASFHAVHCKWCWHHVVGYELWLNEVGRLLVPGGHFVFTLSKGGDDILDIKKWNAAVNATGWECKTEKRIIMICKKNGKLKCEDHSKRKGVEIEALDNIDNLGRSRLLNINCYDVETCVSLGNRFWTAMHIGTKEHETQTSALLRAGKLAMFHELPDPIPVYPRSFDAVTIGCDQTSSSLLKRDEFWIEMHRVLRPGGRVLLLRQLCPWWGIRGLRRARFDLDTVNNSYIVATRKEI